MNTNYKHIFSTSEEILSQEEIRKYLEGKMTDSEQHRVELLLESNPFLADAIEGFQSHPGSIEDLETNPYSSSGKTNIWLWSIGGGILVIGLALWFILPTPTHNGHQSTNSLRQKDNSTWNNNSHQTFEDSIVILESHYSDTSIQIKSERIRKNKTTLPKKEKFATVNEEKIELGKKTDPIKSKSVDTKPPRDHTDKNIKKTKHFDTYHLVDYIVYDYRGKRDEPIKALEPILTGTPANQRNKNSKIDELNPTKEVYYNEFLKEAIVLFSKHNYKQASKKFKIILKKYPQDVNALFYEAMSSYHRNKFKKASLEFQQYLNQPIQLFNEDVEFFLANSLMKSGDQKQAKLLFENIVKNKGFYKNQAQKIITELELK